MQEKLYKIIVFGGNSDIAKAYLEAILNDSQNQKYKFVLIGRNVTQLTLKKNHFEVLGAEVETINADISEADKITDSLRGLHDFDEAFICFSELTNQSKSELESDYLITQINLNFTLSAFWVNFCVNKFILQEYGKLIVIGSVAGDLGRKKNYSYGAAKAGLEVFCQGIQHRLAKYPSIMVHFVKPGIVKTKMTEDIQPTGFLVSQVENVGRSILKAVKRRRRICYVPSHWRVIMFIIKNIPWKIFKRLDF
jgi:decaprenylphospho-beta-D-erythro-pentofuranosid-2-ulose 2-reductase